MFASVAISLIIGIALGQRFKVLILGPVILLILAIALGAGVARIEDVGAVAQTAVVALVGVQIGYLLGIVLRHVAVVMRANRMRAAELSNSPARHRSAH